jgi:hypothetical protein
MRRRWRLPILRTAALLQTTIQVQRVVALAAGARDGPSSPPSPESWRERVKDRSGAAAKWWFLGLFLVRICSLLDSFLLETVCLGMDYVRIFMFHVFWKRADITQRRCCHMECQLSRESSSRKDRCCFHSGHTKSRDRCSSVLCFAGCVCMNRIVWMFKEETRFRHHWAIAQNSRSSLCVSTCVCTYHRSTGSARSLESQSTLLCE